MNSHSDNDKEDSSTSSPSPTSRSETVTDSNAGPGFAMEGSGTQIGRYKLLEKIGEGGFGEVWLAEQKEPVKRRVAVKIIKLGMDTRQVVARFEAERQALAMMDHPNIAKVLDAGATENGRPYFVMELVKGIPITHYCDTNNIGTEERLHLFMQVCRAIQHAHQKGIIHRDIKPSNILVTMQDGVAIPKVIDFGIAKATQQELTEKTVFTQLHQFIGTPAYMSPEQAEMTGIDIDTRSDIYSLGVLLYELLTGRTPFDSKELVSAGIDEMRRIIREKEPIRPSTRLRQTSLAMSPGQLPTHHSSLATDLDWIVMKCLEKDRTRRYETANGLAMDIQRHLNTEPISAHPPDQLYQMRKLVRRHRVAVAATLSVIAALVLGMVGSVWQALRATRAEKEQTRLYEKAESARTGEVRERKRAQEQEQLAQRNLYAADMHIALQAVESFNLERAEQLLNAHRHQTNLLGFEWRYLWQQSRSQEIRQLRGHSERVQAVMFSSDGHYLASRSQDNRLKVWDLRGSHELFTLTNIALCGGFVSNNSCLIVSRGDGSMGTVDALTGREIEFRNLPEPVGFLLAEGTLAITMHAADKAVVRKIASGEEIMRLAVPTGFWREYNRMVITASRDGQKLAIKSAQPSSGTGPQFIDLWDLEHGQMVTNLAYNHTQLSALAFSPNAGVLVAGGTDGAVTVWDLKTFNIIKRVALHEGTVQDIAFSPDGKLFATCSPDQTIVIWDLAARQSVASFGGHGGLVSKICFSPDGRLLVSGNLDGTVRLWNAEYRRPPDTVAAQILNKSKLLFSRDSRKVIVGCSDEFTRVLNVQTLLPIRSIPGVNFPIGLNESGRAILSKQKRLVSWDYENGTFKELAGSDLIMDPSDTAISPSGRFFAFSSWAGVVQIWENPDWKKSAQIGLSSAAHGVCFLDESRILIAERRGDVHLWNHSNGSTNVIKSGLRGVGSIALSPDGQLAAWVDGESSIRVWRLSNGEDLPILKGHRQFIQTVAFSPDGKTLASCSNDGTVRLWNPHLGSEVAILKVFPAAPKGT